MNTSIQIQDHFRDATKMTESESYEALATALGLIMLKFLTPRINAMLAIAALTFLCAWMATERHMGATIVAILTWAGHLAILLIIDIAKGGAKL